jgi:type IV secretion system protein VirB1
MLALVPIVAIVIAGAQLHELVHNCAPNVGPITMKAVVAIESGGNPLAIDDDTAQRSYHPKTLNAAMLTAASLIERGHSFDAGIAQVNSGNFASEGLGLSNMFDPCTNLQAGSRILGRSYAAASKLLWIGHLPQTLAEQQLQQQLALRHAFSIYNSGSAWKSMHYSNLVVAAGLQETVYLQPSIAVPALAALPSDMPATPMRTMLRDADAKTPSSTPRARRVTPTVRVRTADSLASTAKQSELYPKDLSIP